ncbi:MULTISPECIES: ABC transporter ATP-binding protein [Pseudoalteromonas]|jgi:putative ABC transport system ATP-binding protein|uniref:ABC transporter ATP-binding protein n=1 Tax=Pseudoalteromonas lipolytica TaxID=570156 RepID=A0A0P7DWI1_9GAMM|nr:MULTISPECIES: ABC transporter ATP-binding protein [Pseudoalteromonas]MEC8139664.1 ABC transporter ATP-binding protein [Pseudomonadota bacterium]KPM76744.1 phosphonate ABC transporter ATP-binding protein [Pseudoalteromonas sp. UCD-33C]KPM83991.1 phosphonate ABC transporter ATP-binding protein [Pseudoalteromonas lipolytica]KPW00950.1 ABC transporter ATP-binding protein YtrE [Pseudoalteromonas sp. P1-8]KPZ75077.1 ABC transporter ATP-binding protein YtrE [Pseudoalteromonas sp. P1-26]|tara:strand:- start:222 stop:923 length:702 start_codon:yes stop_codon:yes gene_type:complete
MIKLTNLSRVFRTQDVETTALNNINLHVNEGEFLAIMGPSGCGKSTLLSILGMLDSPSAGSFEFLGEDIAGFGEKQLAALRKASIGFVFQSFNLIDELTVFENVELPLQYQNISKSERKQRVEEILKRVAIDHRADHLPQQLSGGQQQRVAVARALVINPKLILADEPTGNLDSKNGDEVMAMLRELNREGTTVIVVTHSEKEGNYADRLVRLLDGQVMVDKANRVQQTAEVA